MYEYVVYLDGWTVQEVRALFHRVPSISCRRDKGRDVLLGQRRKTFLKGQRATAVLPAIQDDWIGGVWRGKGKGSKKGRDTAMITDTVSDLFNFILFENSGLWWGFRILQVSSWSPLDFWQPALWGPTSVALLVPSILLSLAAVSHRASQYYLVSAADGGDLLVAPVFVFPSPAVGSAKRPA